MRLALLFAMVLVLPIIALLIVQFRALLDLRAKTRSALQENLRNALHRVEDETAARLRAGAREMLGATTLADLKGWDRDRIKAHFDATRRAHPEIDQMFAYAGCYADRRERLLFLDAKGYREFGSADFTREAEYANAPEYEGLLLFFVGAFNSRTSAETGNDLIFWQGACTGCSPTSAAQARLFVFRIASGWEDAQKICVTGLSLKTEYLRDRIFPAAMAASGRPGAGEDASPLMLGVFDEEQQPVYAPAGDAAQFELKIPFGPLFPRWTLAGGYRGQRVEALAASYFWRSLLLSLLVIVLLIAGVAMIARVISHEVQLAEAKSAFVSNVSHELKTPLALIRLFAETLELGRVKSPEKAREYHRIIVNESRRLTALIDNILDFARIEAGRREYRFAPCDPAEVVAEVLQSYEYILQREGFELTTTIEDGLPQVMIDRDAIAQAVLNLLNNAVKYSGDAKTIRVTAGRRADRLAIEARDQGPGIPRAEQGRIFEKFYRVGAGLVHEKKGAGLGLALVKHILEAHGGGVTVESAPGRGSAFTLWLPLPAGPGSTKV